MSYIFCSNYYCVHTITLGGPLGVWFIKTNILSEGGHLWCFLTHSLVTNDYSLMFYCFPSN